MKIKKYLIILPFSLLLSAFAWAQVNIQLYPTKEFNLSVDDLINCSVLAAANDETVDIIVTCKAKQNAEPVFTATVKSLRISNRPTNINSRSAGLNIQYANTGLLFNNSKTLRSGTYNVCVEAINSSSLEKLASECEDYNNQPLNPPMLIYPDDKATITMLQPILNWLAPSPVTDPKGMNYQLKLVNLLNNQNQFEAIAANAPILDLNIKGNTNLLYPLNAMPLKWGNTYAWQVEAFDGKVPVGKTEVWQFKIERDSLEELREKYKLNSFVPITRILDNNSYFTNEDLKLQIKNINIDSTTFKLYSSKSNKALTQIDSKNALILEDGKFVLFIGTSIKLKKDESYRLVIEYKEQSYYFIFKYIPSGN
jgi:hypothetical protein